VREGENSAVMLVECRQYRSKRLNQEAVAGLAYRITDTGASGAIIVSPLPLQDGAKKVAEANNIIHVQLGPDSTSENFAIAFFSKIFVGVSDRVGISDHVTAVLVDKDGNTRYC
jgi:predicted polyphosphate/ATP-dependent NAD kinase